MRSPYDVLADGPGQAEDLAHLIQHRTVPHLAEEEHAGAGGLDSIDDEDLNLGDTTFAITTEDPGYA